jgi:hypothetical protein
LDEDTDDDDVICVETPSKAVAPNDDDDDDIDARPADAEGRVVASGLAMEGAAAMDVDNPVEPSKPIAIAVPTVDGDALAL